MRYTLLYYYNPDETGPSADEVQDWMEFDGQVKEAGVHLYEVGFSRASAHGR